MISISGTKLSKITKLTLTILLVYSLGYTAYRAITYYKIYLEKELLTKDLETKRVETDNLKVKLKTLKRRIVNLENSYIQKEELEEKLKNIFKRMSVFDYNIKYIDVKKMCLDRYIIIVQVSAQSEKGLNAAEGILKYLGSIKKSERNDTIYFIDYITTAKEIK